MNILEKTVSLVAPHRCIICGFTGELLCTACQSTSLLPPPARCYRCHALTAQSRVCVSCKSSTKISHTWIAVEYKDAAKKLIYKLKFGRAKAGSLTIAEIIADTLPQLPAEIIVSHVPTANSRVRKRGYDQSKLIAENLCRLRGWQYQPLLVRTGKSRQVGSGRKERFAHLEKALHLSRNAKVAGRHVLLVDDITTTGATIEAAAKVLKDTGAKTVDVAVFAQPVN